MLVRLVKVFSVVAVLAALGCRRHEGPGAAGKPAAEMETRAVQVVASRERQTERVLVANGILAARDQAALSAKVPGRLEEIPVDVGSVVKKGDPIARVQRRDYELKLEQSKAALAAARARVGLPLDGADDSIAAKDSNVAREAQAQLDEQRKTRERIIKLREQGISSQQESESAEAAYLVAVNKYEEALQEANNRKATLAQRRAELNIAEQQLADTVVTAPFDGVVQERKASPGDYLMEGAPLATLVRVDPIRLRLEVAERESMAIREGQPVRFRIEGDTNRFFGKVDRLSPSITADNRMLMVEADIANDGRLRPGAFVRAEIVVNEKALVVTAPKSAVITFAGIEKIFVVENGKAAERRVTTGAAIGNEVEVPKGLKSGESIILEPGALRQGQPVTVAKETASEQGEVPAHGT
jgi:multidrug efflux pump subunit AcrA (membrane-fusion protein)